MSNEPTDTEPTHDDFIPDPDEVEYPSTLPITSKPFEQHTESALDRAKRWEQGEAVPHVVNFEDRSRFRELFTNRRMELLEAVMERPPESIRDLARRLGRDIHDVHDDLHLLAEYDIVHFEDDGRAKKPSVPYHTVRIEVEFSLGDGDESESSASA